MKSTLLHLTNYFPGYHQHCGGAEQATLRTIQSLVSAGYQNCVATTPHDFSSGVALPRIRVQHVRTFESLLCWPLVSCVEILKWYSLQFDPLIPKQLDRIHRRQGFSCVLAYNAQFLTAAAYSWASRHRLPLIQFVYDYWLFCPLTTLMQTAGPCRREHGTHCLSCLPSSMRFIQRLFLYLRTIVFRRIRSLIDWWVVLSEASKRLLVEFGIRPERVVVIPVAMNPDWFPVYEGPVDEHRLFFAGWLQQRKGLEVLIQALPKVVEEFPGVWLDVFTMSVKWEAGYEQRVERLVRELGLEARVRLCKTKDVERFRESWKRAAVVVIPEQWENMSPLILLESQLIGKFVVASRLGGIPEYVAEGVTGLLFDSQDPVDLADRIIQALRGGRQQQIMARVNGPDMIRERCHPDTVGKKLQQVVLAAQRQGVF
ncbi:MAG TPA: glycosyltransferase family 4 protein [Candidatus Ozemobacteraceae bacterium]|nr:glycosyltransferase family 4 protein [Candidatus Ozemobacteraceae bacterium]